jgi:hypothetical protein
MTKIMLDTSIEKDEGILHQFMKKVIWYNLSLDTEYPLNFYYKDMFGRENLSFKNITPYMEYETFLSGYKVKPDISIFDENGNLDTVIECIITARPRYEKYLAYIESNINVIFIDDKIPLYSFKKESSIECKLLVKKNITEKQRFKILFEEFSKINLGKHMKENTKYIGHFKNDSENYFLFNITRSGYPRFFNTTNFSYGKFQKSNSKKIPLFLKSYLNKYNKINPKFMTYVDKFNDYTSTRGGVRTIVPREIEYWDNDI